MDDLGWVSSGGAGSPSVTAAFRMEREECVATTSARRLPVRVQILLEGDVWKDCAEELVQQIVEYLERGETKFVLHARGQNYMFDFENPEGISQTNVSTGKKRMLRLLDTGDEEFLSDECAGPGLDRSSSSLTASTAASSSGMGATGSRASSSGSGGGVVAAGSSMPVEVQQQLSFGPQSRRGGATDHPYRVLRRDPHAQECFRKFEQNESRLCGDWAVFYHSYSFAALIYEVQAAVGSVLFRFRSQYATLPRILVKDFNEIPDAPRLVERFNQEFATNRRDHHPSFRKVAVSAMCSLASTGPEACVAMVFIAGYSCKDLSFKKVLENLLESCYVPKHKVRELAEKIIALSEAHGLDVSQFGGKPCESGKAGHLLQMFVKRSLVDRLTYAAKPYGPVDEEHMPMSKWVNGNNSTQVGQARVVAHPKFFMRADCVRMYVASADPTFHANRRAFQKELVGLLSVVLGKPDLRQKAATGIYGGTLPSWWSAEDQRNHQRF